jgi:hypothetical protein
MNAAIAAILAIIQLVAPGATTTLISAIITALEQIVPVVVQLAQDLMPQITNIINALRSNSAITQDQLVQLKAVEDQLDAAFEAAATAAEAEDAAATQAGS